MKTKEELKKEVQRAMDARRDEIDRVTERLLKGCELGFREYKTAKYLNELYEKMGYKFERGLALTGMKSIVEGKAGSGPRIAVIGELDGLPIPDHPDANPETGAVHACGHNAQSAMVVAIAMALKDTDIMDYLSGSVALFHVPAEELAELDFRLNLIKEGKLQYLVGKPEMMRLGSFDDIDMAMMVHNTGADMKFGIGCTLNGSFIKSVTYYGKAAHAATYPQWGINALNAAGIAFNGIHAQRETFRDEDAVRIHWILSEGGMGVNVIPSETQIDMMVRAKETTPLADANMKVDRALKAGAMAVGARVRIETRPGTGATLLYPELDDVFKENGELLMGEGSVEKMPHKTGSTDLGDLSQIMPAIMPFIGGAIGQGHQTDFHIGDIDNSVIMPAKAMAMSLIDLLYDGASKGNQILENSNPPMTKDQYLNFLSGINKVEEFDPESM